MRYTLQQLEELVPKILAAGHVNTPHKGYPILHWVYMGLDFESDETKHDRYLQLIQTILQCPGCNPDVLDNENNEKPLLAYAAEDSKVNVLNLLLAAGANPNLTSGECQYTALEWAIEKNSISPIPILRRCTRETPQMQENCQAMFDNALEEEDIDTINILLDLGLAIYHPQFRKNLTSAPDIPSGFWIRTIADAKQEDQILMKREKVEDGALAKQRHTKSFLPESGYTHYSPATYVYQSIPISLYGHEEVGIMIRPTADPIAYWYDGHHEELTRDFRYDERMPLNNGQREGQSWEVTPQKIQSILIALYKKEVRQYKEKARNDKSEFDNHGVILDKRLCDIRFSWNEGLLRYKRKQIFGILVNPENETSCKKAFELKNLLSLTVPFYNYRAYPGTTHEVSSDKLIQKWNLSFRTAPTERLEKPAKKPITYKYQAICETCCTSDGKYWVGTLTADKKRAESELVSRGHSTHQAKVIRK